VDKPSLSVVVCAGATRVRCSDLIFAVVFRSLHWTQAHMAALGCTAHAPLNCVEWGLGVSVGGRGVLMASRMGMAVAVPPVLTVAVIALSAGAEARPLRMWLEFCWHAAPAGNRDGLLLHSPFASWCATAFVGGSQQQLSHRSIGSIWCLVRGGGLGLREL
jgi:hypothetical protein